MQSKSMAVRPTGARRTRDRRFHADLAPLPDVALEASKAVAGEQLARTRLAAAAAAGDPLLTATGRPRSVVTLSEYRRGRAPANKGKRYPAEVLTPGEIAALLEALPDGGSGIRSRALIVLLWRVGLRAAEALALRVQDVDLEVGSVTVLHGKGAKRRVVGIDGPTRDYLREWLAERDRIGITPGAALFCTISNDRGGLGRPLGASSLREMLKLYARKAGIEKRVHPHGLRHTCAAEMHREGVPMLLIQQQLGHNDLAMTAHYVNHLEPGELLEAIASRDWPGAKGGPARPATRAAASQGQAAPSCEQIPAYRPVPREPAPAGVLRGPGGAGERGEAKEKILRVLRSNAGRATQAQLARALGIKNETIARHCKQLAGVGEIVRLGEIPRPAGGKRLVLWGLPPLRAVYVLDATIELGSHARRGQGAARVLETIKRLGGRASQAQIGGELGISSETAGVHCRALAARGELERGGLDKSRSNRGSQVWLLPRPERIRMRPGSMLRLAPGSSSTRIRASR